MTPNAASHLRPTGSSIRTAHESAREHALSDEAPPQHAQSDASARPEPAGAMAHTRSAQRRRGRTHNRRSRATRRVREARITRGAERRPGSAGSHARIGASGAVHNLRSLAPRDEWRRSGVPPSVKGVSGATRSTRVL